ncbi:amino acid ABC transporter permease [Paeniglutamicibacter gangotriensis]|uniref:Amino acid ABC transporter permease n=1 Tax=Paeniglutamicibacter gangotriensis TaxID=254787 RepID=A0A5B0EPN9_9MICC|nr:amino acid ABC transporter permease [Paeniglutamicibacter gangotriensis]KAA0979259.1 amino acid ABC transporter permease [Paeniglutamicibacter gangotriensis]
MNALLPDIFTILPTLLGGLKISLTLTFFSLLIGLPIGLVFSFGIVAPNKAFRYVSVFFVEVGRGAPALVLLQLMYYGLPNVNITLSSLISACLALIWTTSAYTAELLRGGIQAVPAGELEGSDALGMSTGDRLRFILIPQGLRIALPSLMGFAVLLFQATSLAYTVAVPELMSQAYSTGSSTFKYLPAFIAAGLIYAAISMPATWLSVFTEKRLSRHL